MLVTLGIGRFTGYQLASLIVTLNRPTLVLGAITGGIVGAVVGVVFYYSLRIIGSDFIVWKGLTAGLLTWVTMEVLFVWLIEGPDLTPPRPIADYYVHLTGGLAFGLALGLLFRRYLLATRA
jgi:hypothetical protein